VTLVVWDLGGPTRSAPLYFWLGVPLSLCLAGSGRPFKNLAAALPYHMHLSENLSRGCYHAALYGGEVQRKREDHTAHMSKRWPTRGHQLSAMIPSLSRGLL